MLFSIAHGSSQFVFAGEATTKIQKQIAARVATLSEDHIILNEAHGSVLVVSTGGGDNTLSSEFVSAARPELFIYEKTVSKSTPQKIKSPGTASIRKTTPSKSKPDPLAAVMNDHRLNLREQGMIHLSSYGDGFVVDSGDEEGFLPW